MMLRVTTLILALTASNAIAQEELPVIPRTPTPFLIEETEQFAKSTHCSSSDVWKGLAVGAAVGGVAAWFSSIRHLNGMALVGHPTAKTVGEAGGWQVYKSTRHAQYLTTALGTTGGGGLGAWVGCAYDELVRDKELTWKEVPNILLGE
jgi:hypothetical protein